MPEPQTSGPAERFNRMLKGQAIHGRVFISLEEVCQLSANSSSGTMHTITSKKPCFPSPLETPRQHSARLTHAGIKANLIWSIDEQAGIGLLDVLPASANKLHAIHFLMQQ